MKRATILLFFLALGLLTSWGSALLASQLAQWFSWPLISTRWHGCWDVEHCAVPWWGYAFILLFIGGPTLGWGVTGFRQSKLRAPQLAQWAFLLAIATVAFYMVFYAAVWP
ncbi:MAG TPA: hypothetical protein VMJ11_15415 [Paraburkholderia sp.]|uniref:hypothetical protein n=1 Tax=Paraburkholderia sp. TaxID=1926495 RepID=UPI002CA95C04|nr:hypothetical protein [Paraburkholderia sp.]HTR08005.1 hypothetical protein [Paraburkholderia sp.]